MPGFPQTYRIVRQGAVESVVIADWETLVALRTELELLRRFSTGTTPSHIVALEARQRALRNGYAVMGDPHAEDVEDMRTILLDGMDTRNRKAIVEICHAFPEVETAMSHDSIEKESQQFRKDVANQIETSGTDDAELLSEAFLDADSADDDLDALEAELAKASSTMDTAFLDGADDDELADLEATLAEMGDAEMGADELPTAEGAEFVTEEDDEIDPVAALAELEAAVSGADPEFDELAEYLGDEGDSEEALNGAIASLEDVANETLEELGVDTGSRKKKNRKPSATSSAASTKDEPDADEIAAVLGDAQRELEDVASDFESVSDDLNEIKNTIGAAHEEAKSAAIEPPIEPGSDIEAEPETDTPVDPETELEASTGVVEAEDPASAPQSEADPETEPVSETDTDIDNSEPADNVEAVPDTDETKPVAETSSEMTGDSAITPEPAHASIPTAPAEPASTVKDSEGAATLRASFERVQQKLQSGLDEIFNLLVEMDHAFAESKRQLTQAEAFKAAALKAQEAGKHYAEAQEQADTARRAFEEAERRKEDARTTWETAQRSAAEVTLQIVPVG